MPQKEAWHVCESGSDSSRGKIMKERHPGERRKRWIPYWNLNRIPPPAGRIY